MVNASFGIDVNYDATFKMNYTKVIASPTFKHKIANFMPFK